MNTEHLGQTQRKTRGLLGRLGGFPEASGTRPEGPSESKDVLACSVGTPLGEGGSRLQSDGERPQLTGRPASTLQAGTAQFFLDDDAREESGLCREARLPWQGCVCSASPAAGAGKGEHPRPPSHVPSSAKASVSRSSNGRPSSFPRGVLSMHKGWAGLRSARASGTCPGKARLSG